MPLPQKIKILKFFLLLFSQLLTLFPMPQPTAIFGTNMQVLPKYRGTVFGPNQAHRGHFEKLIARHKSLATKRRTTNNEL